MSDRPFLPSWVRESMNCPDCEVCGEPVLSKQPFHTICGLARSQATHSIPLTYIVGGKEDREQ